MTNIQSEFAEIERLITKITTKIIVLIWMVGINTGLTIAIWIKLLVN